MNLYVWDVAGGHHLIALGTDVNDARTRLRLKLEHSIKRTCIGTADALASELEALQRWLQEIEGPCLFGTAPCLLATDGGEVTDRFTTWELIAMLARNLYYLEHTPKNQVEGGSIFAKKD